MLGQSFDETQEAAFGVEPGIRAQLLLEGLQTLDDTRHAEVIVSFGTIERTNDQVNDAKVEHLLSRFFDRNTLFLLFNALHELLCICILTCHDIGDAKVGQDNGRNGKQIVHLSADEGLVVADCVTILVILHEENMRHVQLPSLMLTAKLSRLTENLLHHGIVVIVPVDLSLHHEHWDVLVESQIILLQSAIDRLGVSGDPSILDGLGLFAECVDVLVSELFKFSEGFFFGGLVEDEVLEELEVLLRQALVRQVRVLGQNICGQIVVLVLAVEQDEVREGFRWEGWVLEQEVKFFEASGRVLLDVHQCSVMKGHRIQLILVPRWHVHQGFTSSGRVFHRVLDGCLEVESFNQSGLFQCLSVANALDLDALRVGAHAELGMFSHSLLNDVGDVLQRRCELLKLVVAEGNVVGNIALVAGGVERLLELGLRVLVLLFLVKDATLGNDSFTGIGWHLRDQTFGVRHLFKLVLDVHLELQDFVGVVGMVNLLCNLGSLLVHARLQETLSVVQLVLDDIWVELGELIVHIRSATVILNVEVAVCEQGKCRSISWRKLKLIR